MKKTFVKVLSVVFIMAAVLTGFTACTPRDRTLRVYNWGEYMDETVVDSFIEWYAENNDGEKIRVVYKEFAGNEDVYSAISKQKQDWDLICPSEYMVERMIDENLLLPIDKDVVDVSAEGFMNDLLLDIIDSYDKGLTYSVPYIWGTFGIMYDTEDPLFKNNPANVAKLNSWSALWDNAFAATGNNAAGKVYMKDQVRDSYAVTMLYLKRNELKAASDNFTNYDAPAYKTLMKDIFLNFSAEKMAEAKAALLDQSGRKIVARLETDEGKTELAEGTGEGKLGLFWSCDAGFAMNDYESGNSTIPGNKNLKYIVPDEGSNVWVDSWVIPKYAGNERLANLFLQYLMTDEICKLNTSYAGAPSANQKAMDELKTEIEEDEDGFFNGTYAGFKEMYLEMMFPTDITLRRCQAMGSFGESSEAMDKMWQDYKNERG